MNVTFMSLRPARERPAAVSRVPGVTGSPGVPGRLDSEQSGVPAPTPKSRTHVTWMLLPRHIPHLRRLRSLARSAALRGGRVTAVDHDRLARDERVGGDQRVDGLGHVVLGDVPLHRRPGGAALHQPAVVLAQGPLHPLAGDPARRHRVDPAMGYAVTGWSVPQYLHLDAAAGRSLDRQAGQVLTGAGSPNTTWPRRAWMCL